jgi:Cu-Zn family superoxide dismutase
MRNVAVVLCILFLMAACAHTRGGPAATAKLQPTSGSNATGSVQFQELADGSVQVKVDLTGVPAGIHGFHVHDKGSCADNGMGAGGHFNPMSLNHGSPDAMPHHAGDFGNVTANASGEVHTQFVTHSVTVREGQASAIGHAVILHASPDDLTTQPTGNAGARIACGIVEPASGKM